MYLHSTLLVQQQMTDLIWIVELRLWLADSSKAEAKEALLIEVGGRSAMKQVPARPGNSSSCLK